MFASLSQGDDERGAEDVTAASTKATPENVKASKTAVHSFRRVSGMAARARGTWRRTTHRKIISPDSDAASRAVGGKFMPTPPAISATPAKYVQKRAPGIHAGTSVATNSANRKCWIPHRTM